MTQPNVPPNPWHEVAANLALIAEDLHGIAADVPVSNFIELHLQPSARDDDARIDQIDALTLALLGEPGEVREMCDGTHHYDGEGRRGHIRVKVYGSISSERAVRIAAREQLEAKELELARLRAEVAELRAAVPVTTCGWCPIPWQPDAAYHPGGRTEHVADPTGLDYSREPDDPTPASPARVPDRVGGIGETGVVSEGSACPDCPDFTPDSIRHLHEHLADAHGVPIPDGCE